MSASVPPDTSLDHAISCDEHHLASGAGRQKRMRLALFLPEQRPAPRWTGVGLLLRTASATPNRGNTARPGESHPRERANSNRVPGRSSRRTVRNVGEDWLHLQGGRVLLERTARPGDFLPTVYQAGSVTLADHARRSLVNWLHKMTITSSCGTAGTVDPRKASDGLRPKSRTRMPCLLRL